MAPEADLQATPVKEDTGEGRAPSEGHAGAIEAGEDARAAGDSAVPSARVIGGSRAVLAATAIMTLVNFAFIALLDRSTASIRTRGMQYLYELGHNLALGLVAYALVRIVVRFGSSRPAIGYTTLGLIAVGLDTFFLRLDLEAFSYRSSSLRFGPALLALLVLVAALSVPVAAFAGSWVSRRGLGAIGVAAGTALLVVNHWVLPNDYAGVHFQIGILGATLIVASLHAVRLPSSWPGVGRTLPLVLAGTLATGSVLIWPSNAVLSELLRLEGSIATRVFARLHPAADESSAGVPLELHQWFRERSLSHPVQPSDPAFLPRDGVVILLTIDALRADVVSTGKFDRYIPSIARLRERSLQFVNARSPGSQTVYSVATLFAGTYFSQQYWTRHPDLPDLWPHEEQIVRFPRLLAERHVPTITYSGARWMVNEYGIVRGFKEEKVIRDRQKYARAGLIMEGIISRLGKHAAGPLFLYAHFLDPHAPYDLGGERGTTKERYLREVELVDKEIGNLIAVVQKQGLWDRTLFIVSADHGEAFGEHGSRYHATTLYEEQIRVPLLIGGPLVEARKVETPVSLVDLGPTILDAFGVETPGYFMGESLVPALRGKPLRLTRPIIIEGRLKKAMIFSDGHKAIVDDRHHTEELYDLRTDPGERHNLLEESNKSGHVQVLREFFRVHTIRREGYDVPYRP